MYKNFVTDDKKNKNPSQDLVEIDRRSRRPTKTATARAKMATHSEFETHPTANKDQDNTDVSQSVPDSMAGKHRTYRCRQRGGLLCRAEGAAVRHRATVLCFM